jgi:uncharacterized protein
MKKLNNSNRAIQGVLLVSILLISFTASSQYPGQYPSAWSVSPKVQVKASSFNLEDIKLLDSPFKETVERNGKWLLTMDINRLLHSFRINAGIRTQAKSLDGWEKLDTEVRGHTLGHVMSGLALMYATTGNVAYKNRGDSIVKALSECQRILNQDGYLSAFPPNFIDRCIAGQPVWAPWYTLHKIIAGLADMYIYAGNKKALELAEGMSGWAYKKLNPLTPEQLALMMKNEFGGMTEVAYNLYSITGNADDKKLAELFFDHIVLDPLSNGIDDLPKLHANTTIPIIIGEARGYELTGDDMQKKIAEFFWQTVIDHHTYANGGNSDFEHFFAPDKLSEHLTARTTETCNTYNMLKLTRHLFTWSAEAKYADYYEQALYNHILASPDPKTGMVSYFMPMKPGLFKVYSTPTASFWCCVASGFESNAKYAEAIYYHNDNGIYINLFIPSELTWKEKGIRVIQQTTYPEEPVTHIKLQSDKDIKMSLNIRYPSWAANGVTIKINGKNVIVKSKPGSYIVLNRSWKNGDNIDITFPMSLRLLPANDNPDKAAIAYGPVLLAGKMGKEGIQEPAPYAAGQNDYNNYYIPSSIISTLNAKGRKITDWLKQETGKSLLFRTSGVAVREIELIPYYKLNDERYVLYWDLK